MSPISVPCLVSSRQGCGLFCRRRKLPIKGSSYGASCAQSKLIVSLISVVLLRTERFLNGDYTMFPCAWESVGLGLLGGELRTDGGEVKWPSAWGPAQPAEG